MYPTSKVKFDHVTSGRVMTYPSMIEEWNGLGDQWGDDEIGMIWQNVGI